MAESLNSAGRLRQAIGASVISREKTGIDTCTSERLRRPCQRINQIVAQIKDKRDSLDRLDRSIEPVLVKLLVIVDTEVGRSRLRIEGTRQKALRALFGATIFGLLSAGIIAILLHCSVSRNIINPTRITNQFRNGKMEVRASVNSSDELGDLGEAFNEMAESVQKLNAELCEQAIR